MTGPRARPLATTLPMIAFVSLAAAACGGQPTVPVPVSLVDGEELFELRAAGGEPGCVTCHATDGDQVLVGPSLDGIATRAADRVPGLGAEAYLRQSIVDPRAHLVDGFADEEMPDSFASIFSDRQIEALVTYLLELT